MSFREHQRESPAVPMTRNKAKVWRKDRKNFVVIAYDFPRILESAMGMHISDLLLIRCANSFLKVQAKT